MCNENSTRLEDKTVMYASILNNCKVEIKHKSTQIFQISRKTNIL